MAVGFSSIMAIAAWASLTSACFSGGNFFQVVPRRLSSVCHPASAHHPVSWSRNGGVFLKSTKRYAMPCSDNQARAVLIVSQLVMPYIRINGTPPVTGQFSAAEREVYAVC